MAPLGTHLNRGSPGNIGTRQRLSFTHDLFGSSLGDKASTVPPRTWPKIDHVVGPPNGLFIVLHDKNCVSQIAQVFESVEKAPVVAMMQADGGLIENIENTAKLRSNLRRQANALSFAAGQSGG